MRTSVRWLLLVSAVLTGSGILFLYWRLRFFFRDPHRVPPADTRSVVSPADGFVVYVKRIEQGVIPHAAKRGRVIPLEEFTTMNSTASGYLIGIYMSEYSVHRNRIPIAGRVTYRRHQSAAPFNKSMARVGANLITRHTPYDDGCDYMLANERLTLGITHDSGSVVTVTQIADLWVDRIVAHVGVGEKVSRGEQYGMIRFGSQCDVFLPDDLVDEIKVTPGQYVFAGESVVAQSPVSVDAPPRSEEES